MELTHIKKTKLSDANINISINLKNEKVNITLNYTCSECGGYGCRFTKSSENCNGGTVTINLDKNNCENYLNNKTVEKLNSIVKNLFSSDTLDFSDHNDYHENY